MLERDHQRIIDELQRLIGDTQATLNRADAHLLDIRDRAIKQQREHTRALLFDVRD